jgi:hypothetical protein
MFGFLRGSSAPPCDVISVIASHACVTVTNGSLHFGPDVLAKIPDLPFLQFPSLSDG